LHAFAVAARELGYRLRAGAGLLGSRA
jgi:hypothetical protein